MTNSDIIIVGGGIIGLMCGWRLSHQGHTITLLDGSTHNTPPATIAAAGMLAPSFESSDEKYNALDKLGWDSLALWKDWSHQLTHETEIDIDYRDDGIIGVARTGAELATLKSDFTHLRDQGHEAHWLDEKSIYEYEPALQEGLMGGYISCTERQVDPARVYNALNTLLHRNDQIRYVPRKAQQLIENNGKIHSVLTEEGHPIEADVVILATGAYLHQIDASFPLPRLHAVKGEALAVMTAAPATSPVLRHVIRHPDVYLCPKSDGRITIGATSLPHHHDLSVDDDRITALRLRANTMVPTLQPLPETARWAGLRPATENGQPLIGSIPDTPEGLLCAIGHYRNGILLAPITAQKIAEKINDNIPI